MQLRIKEIRKLKGLSQQDLVSKIKIIDPGTLIDQGTLSRYETGEYQIRFSTLCRIAKALDVHVTMLFVSNDPLVPEAHQEEPAHAIS